MLPLEPSRLLPVRPWLVIAQLKHHPHCWSLTLFIFPLSQDVLHGSATLFTELSCWRGELCFVHCYHPLFRTFLWTSQVPSKYLGIKSPLLLSGEGSGGQGVGGGAAAHAHLSVHGYGLASRDLKAKCAGLNRLCPPCGYLQWPDLGQLAVYSRAWGQ